MTRRHTTLHAFLACPAFLCAVACGGSTVEVLSTTGSGGAGGMLSDAANAGSAGSTSPPVAGSGGTPGDSSVEPEAAGDGAVQTAWVCDGESKVQTQGTLVSPAQVTATRVVLNCPCDVANILLHRSKEAGPLSVQVHFGLITMPSPFLGGEYEIDTQSDSPNPSVIVTDSRGDTGAQQRVTGQLSWRYGKEGEPLEVRFCLHVDSPGDTLDGTNLYVDNVVVGNLTNDTGAAFWLLKDKTTTADMAQNHPLDDLELAASPLVSMWNMDFYDATSHTVHLTRGSNLSTDSPSLPEVPFYGLPFVVTANGKRVYLGSFMSSTSSYIPPIPTILDDDATDDSSFTIHPVVGQGVDFRSDAHLIQALHDASKLVYY
jgi:hypothetical protein